MLEQSNATLTNYVHTKYSCLVSTVKLRGRKKFSAREPVDAKKRVKNALTLIIITHRSSKMRLFGPLAQAFWLLRFR